jgi:hypothetical protein
MKARVVGRWLHFRWLLAPWLAGVCLAVVAMGCGPSEPPKAPELDRSVPHWQDAFDQIPEIFVVVRPVAMRQDATYGAFVKALTRAAAARSSAVATSRMLEAIEGSEEVVVGFRSPDDAIVVLKGAPAQMDAAKLTDVDGRALWRASGSQAPVPELVREERTTAQTASLFVLPQRVWVIAVGQARARARQAFATPSARPEPKVDPRALAFMRLDGPSLVRAVGPLRKGDLEPLGRKLASATIALRPAREGLIVTFQYPEDDPAAWAEMTLKQVGDRLSNTQKLAWLKTLTVSREGNAVVARVELPPSLIEKLPNVASVDGM